MSNKTYSSVGMNRSANAIYLTTLIKVIRSVLFLLLLLPSLSGLAQSQTYTGTGTFVVPAGVTSVNVQCWGAGGGGSTTTTVGGGGGGGAYASGNVTVVPGSTYNIVIGTTGSSGVNGTNTTFNTTSVVAAGGSSAANNSSIGALGGTIAASTGTIKYPGGNGASGGGVVAGGAGGGAGSTGIGNNASTYIGGLAKTINGGAGGNGRRTASGNGGNGANYGGGGGGAYGNGISRTGGLGGRGLCIISWACPIYSVSSVSVPASVCRGSAARITLNSTVANLPVGVYTVTYNLSAPNAVTGRTVSMTVTTAGTGAFNTIALATSGATTITITKLLSGVSTRTCTNTITSNNTAVIAMSNAIPVIATQPVSQAVCVGSAVTLSVSATGATTYQWKKNGNAISGATSSAYTIASYCACDAGSYTVDVINGCGTRASGIAYVSTKANQPAVTAGSSAAIICAGTAINLTSTTPSNAVTVLYENFNGTSNNFTTTNTSTGGTPANAAWSLKPNAYNYSGTTFNSNDNSQFYISNSNAQGAGGSTATILQTQPFSTKGLSTASFSFYQYYRFNTGAERARVEISTNGTTWTALATYATTQGASNSFALATFNLSAYLNQSLVIIRFRYTATTAWYWAIDNVNVSGTLTAPAAFSWSSTPAGYSSSLQNPTGVTPLVSAGYKVTATNAAGCTNSSSVAITVNTPPAIIAQPSASAAVCPGNGIQTITVGATGTGLTYSWRKGGVAVVNGAVISGQGTASLTFTNPTAINTGSYDVVISGTCTPSVTSAAAVISLNTVVSITAPASPASQTVLINNSPTNLSIAAIGTAVTYQWYSNTINSNSGGISVGAANGGQTNLYTPPVNTAGTTYYYCIINGACGTVTSSAVAVVVTNINTWAGGGSSNWNSSTNWSMGIVPTSTNDAVIPAGNTPYPVLSSSATVNNLTINGAATLSIGANTFTINGTVAGTGTITGSETSSIVIGSNAGTLRFTTGGTNNYLKNFTINNGASATLGSPLNITGGASSNNEGTLTVNGTGILNTGGYLTIKSNSFGTARIAQGNAAGGYIVGDVTVERYIPRNAGKAWRLLASNTNGQTINAAWQEGVTGGMLNPNAGFGIKITSSGASVAAVQALGFDTLSLGKSIFKYNQSADMLDYVPNTNSTQLNSQHGYFIFIRGDRSAGQFTAGAPTTSTVLRCKGTLFQGDQPAVSLSAGQYAMVRNPFASRIDVRQLIRTGGLVAAYQVWDPKLTGAYGGGAFQTFTRNTLTGNYEVSPGGGSYGANGSVQNFIESGSAFYVQANGSAGTVQVLESSKSSGSQVASFRPSSPATGNSRILYNLYANNPSTTDVVDGGFIDFNDVYSNDVDVFDVRKNQNFNENFAIIKSNIELVVERRPAVASADTLFFRMYNMRQVSYRIDIEANDFDTLLTSAVLQDQYTGINTSLNLSVLNSYTFTVNADAASRANDRFKILMRQAGVVPVTFTWIKATQVSNKIAVEWKVAAEVNVDHYEVEKSVNGRSFSKEAVIPAANISAYTWVDEKAVSGNNFYRVKAIDVSGQIKYTDVAKVTMAKTNGTVMVSPNPVQDGFVNILFVHQPAGNYNVSLINTNGQVVYKTVLQHHSQNSNYKINLPQAIDKGVFELLITTKENTVSSQRLVIGQ